MRAEQWVFPVVVLMLSMGLNGCGDDPAIDRAEVDAFLARAATHRCEGALRCAAGEIQRSQSLGTQAHCEAAVLGELRNRSVAIGEAAAREEIRFDASGIEACLNALERDGCEALVSIPVSAFAWPPECASVLSGTIAAGEACQIDEQCDGGACECGVCVANAGLGESCAAARCGSGLVCVEQECVAVSHEGDACTQLAPEDVTGSCPPNLWCVDGACRLVADFRTAGEGAECHSLYDREAPRVLCAANLECLFDRPDSGTCLPAHGAGDTCEGGTQGLCPPGMLCHGPSTDLRCRPYLAEGEECFPSGWGDPCGPDLACDLNESRCRRLSNNGEACGNLYDCHSGFCDDAGVCADASDLFCL